MSYPLIVEAVLDGYPTALRARLKTDILRILEQDRREKLGEVQAFLGFEQAQIKKASQQLRSAIDRIFLAPP
ncbi:MAG: hypothetical protein IGS48_02455 [Oscillatoriales cyanobacterium C42_A2020_001]|nr:hypothetical protein [Leptolyngbyaceae cyanobacterium C42_A2020_001]